MRIEPRTANWIHIQSPDSEYPQLDSGQEVELDIRQDFDLREWIDPAPLGQVLAEQQVEAIMRAPHVERPLLVTAQSHLH